MVPTDRTATTRLVAAFAVAALAAGLLVWPAAALPGGVDACFFRDLNGSSSQGDEVNAGQSGEVAFATPITVELVDVTGATSVVADTDPGTGCVEFAGLVDGHDYVVRATYPTEYYSSPAGGDTDFTPGPPPAVAGDPFTADHAFTFASGDDRSIRGGVSGLPELSLGYFTVPSGEDMIQTGTAPFDTTGNCPTPVSGDDCGQYDQVVRTNDTVTIGYTITADNIPDGNVAPLENVILEQVITPAPDAVVEVTELHPSCLTSGVDPASSIATDAATGVVTVTCNLGSKDNGTTIVPFYVRVDGQSVDGSTFDVDARVYAGGDRAQVFDDNSTLESPELTVSAAPRFNITKGNDPSNPYNRVVYLQTTRRTNPVTGVEEYGVNYRWDISVLYEGGVKGQAALLDPITFSDTIPAEFEGWVLVACNSTPYGAGSMPNDDRPEEDWGARGTWACSEDRVDNEIDITVTGADTDGSPVPTEGTNGTSLAAGPYIAFAGSVQVWYPLSDFYRSVDPTWDYGDDPILGDYPLDNLVTQFDPDDLAGNSNFGDGTDPAADDDRSVNVRISEVGGFSKHVGAYEWADARVPNGVAVGSNSTYPCGASSIGNGSLMSGQTQSCSSGDAPVQAGERVHWWAWLRNNGTFPWPADSAQLCDAFDSSTMDLITWTGGEHAYVRTNLPTDAIIVEYATASFGDDVAGSDWTNQEAAIASCTAPNDDWSTDPTSFDPDPDVSRSMVGMVRVRVDDTVVSEIQPSEYFQLSFPVEVRDTFLGGPDDGQPVPVGTIVANHANVRFGSRDWNANQFDAAPYTDSGRGDRLFFNRHQVRIDKTASVDPSSATDDDLGVVEGGDTVVWWLQPGITAVTPAVAENVQIVDTLPVGVSFDEFCQASQAYPDADVVLSSVTVNPDGTTTLVFDLGDRPTNVGIGPIPICTRIDNFQEAGTDLVNQVEIRSDGDVSPISARTDDRTVTIVASGELQLVKTVDAPLELQLDTQTYEIGWTNLSSDFDFSPPDVIDVWPYNGDAVNPINQRTEFDSAYSGAYFLTDWLDQPTTRLEDGSTEVTGGTWYYSADDPATIPYDADDPANDLVSGSVTWCTRAELEAPVAPCDFGFADSTAARFVQTDILASKSSVTVSYTFQAGTIAEPNNPADRYVNRFAARTASVDDLIRSNEVLVQVLSMNLGDFVFLDADVDGRYTDGVDRPRPGVPVELWGDDGSGSVVQLATTVTDGDGRYVFDDLLQGTFEVRIPVAELSGGSLDTLTPSVAPTPADDDGNEDVDHQARVVGAYVSSGPVTLSADTTYDPPLGDEPVGENLFGLGNPYTYDNLTNMSVDLGFRGDPDVRVVKEVCDADLGPCDPDSDPLSPADGWTESVVVPFTDTATWRISVTNTGDEVLTAIAVDDDIEDSCDRPAGSLADLALGETVSWVCETTDVLADRFNTATVTAEGLGSGVEVIDVDSAEAETPPTDPDITIVKYVEGDDAQTAPGVVVESGSSVTFTYDVTTGSGSVPLTSITVVDDAGTPLDPADDFAPTYVSGDADGDGRLDLDETWRYESAGHTAVEGQYGNWAEATGLPVVIGATSVSDRDPANYYGVLPGIGLEKLVNGDDADSAPGVVVAAGADVTFTYIVTNTGNAALTGVAVLDDAGTPGDPADDWTATYVSGDTDADGALDPTETWYFTHTTVAELGAYVNEATTTGTSPTGSTATDDDPAHYIGAAPALAVEKATNGVDADDPADAVLVADGGSVVWTYTVTNTGNVPIDNVRVSDDAGTPGDPADDYLAAYVSGDTDDDGDLDVDEEWLFRATGSATEETHRNLATTTGRGPDVVDDSGTVVPGAAVSDDDPSGYEASRPGVSLVKRTNATDNETAPGVAVTPGSSVTWTYEVTNTGNQPLSAISVTDDAGTPGDASDDWTAAYDSGDTDGDGSLDVGEVWVFTATAPATVGSYRNEAVVSARPPTVTDVDGSPIVPPALTDTAVDHYFGVDPGIALEKLVNGDDADVAPGVTVAAGEAVVFTYAVTNTGNAPLDVTSFVDDAGTPGDPVDDWSPTFVDGDTDGDGLLDVDETWRYEHAGEVAAAGPYANLATVEALAGDGRTVVDDDPAHLFGSDPAVGIEKTTNTVDADDPADAVLVADGGPVVWRYTVSNLGNVPLDAVTVSDDAGTPGDPADDVLLPYISGDDDGDGLLDVDEVWLFRGVGAADDETHRNLGRVSAVGPDVVDDNGTVVDGPTVGDDDPSGYRASRPGIALTKVTNSVDNDVAPGIYVEPGSPVTWTYTVVNTGNQPLSGITVTDDAGTPDDPADDLVAGYVSGDDDGDGLLDVDETWIFDVSDLARAGSYVNVATVSGRPPTVTDGDGLPVVPEPITDTAVDHYYGIDGDILLRKLTNGVDNPLDPGGFVPVGATVTWTYEVRNPTETELSNVVVVDDAGTPLDPGDDFTASFVSGDDDGDGRLDPDETWIHEATGVAEVGSYLNRAEVTADPPPVTNPDGSTGPSTPVSNSDDDRYWGAAPAVEIVKSVAGEDADSEPGVFVAAGDTVDWTYEITNTGNTPLVDLVVTDDQGVDVTCPVDHLEVGASTTCTGRAEIVEPGPYRNVGTVAATPAQPSTVDPGGFEPVIDPDTGTAMPPVVDDDPAHHFGVVSSMELAKEVCRLDEVADCDPTDDRHWAETAVISDGDDVAWRIRVTNTGNVSLVDLEVVDERAPRCDRSLDALAPGVTWSYRCVMTDVDEPTTNTAVVTAVDEHGTLPPVEASDIAETLEPAELTLTKATPDDELVVGAPVTYTLVLENTGVSDAVDVVVEDRLPDGLGSIQVPPSGELVHDAQEGTLTWRVDSLAVGETVSVTYRAIAVGSGSLVNVASIVSDHEENDLSDNTDDAVVTVSGGDRPSVLAFTGGTTGMLVAWGLVLVVAGHLLRATIREPSIP